MQFSRVFVCVHVFVSLIVVVVCLANDENFKNVQRNSKHRFLFSSFFSSIYFSSHVSLMTVVFSMLNLTVV